MNINKTISPQRHNDLFVLSNLFMYFLRIIISLRPFVSLRLNQWSVKHICKDNCSLIVVYFVVHKGYKVAKGRRCC
jgi:hypothetical protein